MVGKFLDKWRGLIPPPSPTLLIGLVLIGGGLLLIPNGIDARDQRYINLTIIFFFCVALFMTSVSVSTGALLLYVSGGLFFQGGFDMMNVQTILIMAMFYLFIVCSRGKIDVDSLYDVLCFIAIVNVLWQILQNFGIYLILHPENKNLLSGLMASTNDMSAFFACLIPTFFRKNRWPLLIIPIAGMMATRGRAGILSATISSVAFILFSVQRKNILKWCGLAGLVLALSASFFIFVKPLNIMHQTAYRFYGWGEAIKIGMDKPLFGWGLGQYRFIIPLITSAKYLSDTDRQNLFGVVRDKVALVETINKIKKKNPTYFENEKQQSQIWTEAHNEYIETFFNIGMIGLFLGLVMMIRHLWLGFFIADKIPISGLLASCITSFFHFSWHVIPIALATVFYMAIIKAKGAEQWKIIR